MTLRPTHLLVLLAVCLFLSFPEQARAQSYSQTARAFVPAPRVLGMGDAAVAFPSRQGVFFYNPAHLAQVARPRPHINLVGVRGLLSSNFFEQERFARTTLQPALEEGTVDSLASEDLERAIELGRTRTFAGGDVLLPSFMVRKGAVGFGGGLFTHSLVRYRATDGGAGMPYVDFTAQADAIGLASVAVDFDRLGVAGFSAGASLKYARRFLTLKEKILDRFRDAEGVYLLEGSSLGLDVGVLYELPVAVPGQLRVGAAAYDLAARPFDYAFSSDLREEFGGEPDPNAEPMTEEETEALVAAEVARANEKYALSPSYRVGLAYTTPELFGLLKESGIALDYLNYAKPLAGRQVFLSRFRLGAQTTIGRLLALRAGLSQGYTTFGAGLNLPVVKIDYAYYGVEEGRLPGQLPSWNHTFQLTLSLF